MISVLINNYNNGPWIRACVDSVLAQTLPPDEIILYDDGSTDDSLAILEPHRDRIRLIEGVHDDQLPGVQSQALAIYRALLASSGDHVYLLDGDDCFLPDHLERYNALWQTDPDFVMIHGSMEMIDSQGTPSHSLYRSDRDRLDYRKAIYRYNETDYFYPTSSLAFRRDFLTRELPLDFSDGMVVAIDARLSFAAVCSGRIGFVSENTAQYRHRSDSMSMEVGLRQKTRIEENRLRAHAFNSIARARKHPPIWLWLNINYLLQLARQLLPEWLARPFLKLKLSSYRKMANRRPNS
jgi:glycosyltransferase involved in cell wall biosynthesis